MSFAEGSVRPSATRLTRLWTWKPAWLLRPWTVAIAPEGRSRGATGSGQGAGHRTARRRNYGECSRHPETSFDVRRL